MKNRMYKICALLLAGTLGMAALTGCSEEKAKETSAPTEKSAESAAESETDIPEEFLAEMMEGTFRASDSVFPVQDKYEYPYMGLTAVLPRELKDRMEKMEVAMLCDEMLDDSETAFQYALMSWSVMTEEQRDAEVEKMGTGYYDWVNSLERIGTLGMYAEDLADKLDEITGCTEHKELGESADGAYKYYLSTNPDADSTLTDAVKQITTEITDLVPFSGESAFTETVTDKTDSASISSLGKFTTQDIEGTTYTEEMFQDYDLTMINVFTTWCSPCVKEIPDLQKLKDEMEDKGVNVVGVVLDASDGAGNIDEEAVEKAKLIAEKTGVSYTFLLPDETNLNGRLDNIYSVPETFFVDKDGNIVGETHVGSDSLENWKSIVEEELSNLKGAE